MDRDIYNVLKNYDISDLEIQDILNLSQMFNEISNEEFAKNCWLLIKYGYPKSDLDVLLLANPNLFVKSEKDLENDLLNLNKKYGDIEVILKQNPYII